MNRRVSIVAAAALAGLLLANGRASAQIVYQFANAQGNPLVGTQIVAPGSTFSFRVYLAETPITAPQINSAGGLGTAGVLVNLLNTAFATFGTPVVAAPPWSGANTAGSSTTAAILSNFSSFTVGVLADATGRVYLGDFSFVVAAGATGSTTLRAQDQNAGVGDNTSHFNPPFAGLDSLISPGSLVVQVPEPTSMTLCGVAVVGLAVRRFRRRDTAVAA